MSKAELSDREGQHDAGAHAPGATSDGLVDGLPAALHAQVMAIRPGDARALADLVGMFRESFAPQILALAAGTPHLGNALVQRAIKMSETRTMPDIAPGVLGHGGLDAPAPAQPATAAGPAAAAGRDGDTDRDKDRDKEDLLRGLDGGESVALRPDVRAQVLALQPGDARALADLLQSYPGMSDDILMLARQHLGIDTVAKAVDLKQHAAHGAAGSQGAAPHQGGELAPISSDSHPAVAAPAGGAAKAAPDAAWLASARAYNAAHAELVADFNELTNDVCCPDGEPSVDPHAVARWQTHHGLDPDGKIGPHTVAAARKTRAQASQAAVAPAQVDARPPV